MRTLTDAQRRFLTGLFPGEDCLLELEETYVFGADAGRDHAPPLAVVRPTALEQITELMAWAQQESMPVYPRGRATNLVGGCVPDRGGVVVSTLKLDALLEVSNEDFVAVVQPGMVTSEFQAAVEARGLFYPPDPASVKISTIGGNVATCAGGMRAVKYGVTRDYVLGMTVVLPGGEVVRLGGRTHKNVVGLDLTRLFVGAEGTLGVIADITLKLLPKPKATASLLAGYHSSAAALAAASEVLRRGFLPTAMEFMGETVVRSLTEHKEMGWPEATRAALLFRLDGGEAGLSSDLAELERIIAGTSPSSQSHGMGPEEEEPLWDVRRSINPASFRLGPHKLSDDVTLPRGKVGAAVAAIAEMERSHGLPIAVFGHLGDGNLHVNIMYDKEDPAQMEAAHTVKDALLHKVVALGGSMSGEHGIGSAKAAYLDLQLSTAERRLMRQVKTAFDPQDIMNPGKAY